MDVITFAAPVLLRHLTYSDAKKVPIQEFYHEKVLEGLGLSQDEVWYQITSHKKYLVY
jgi:flap endonuclease-1